MAYFVATEQFEPEDNETFVFEMNATLSRVRRWCNAKDYKLIVYGDMQVFDKCLFMNSESMKQEILQWINRCREHREYQRKHKNDPFKPQSLDFILSQAINFPPIKLGF